MCDANNAYQRYTKKNNNDNRQRNNNNKDKNANVHIPNNEVNHQARSVRARGLVDHAGTEEPVAVRAHNGRGEDDTLTWLQTQQLAQTLAQAARPAIPFEIGSTNAYAIHMARFDLVANTRGMDSRAKVLELSNWFAGTPKTLVDAVAADPDADLAYATARSELDSLFGGQRTSVNSLIAFVKEGKPIQHRDYKGHLDLYGQLRAAETTATASGRRDDLDKKDILETILEKKLPHMEEKFWKKNEKRRLLGESPLTFKDLLMKLQLHISTLSAMSGNAQSQTAKIAATNVQPSRPTTRQSPPEVARNESYARRLVTSPPKQQQEKCHVCSGFHATVACATLAKLAADDKVEKLKQCGMCLSCIQHGHVVKQCPHPLSRCEVCFKGHHTILHGRTYKERPTPAPRRQLSATAASFDPAAATNRNNNAVAQPTLDPTATTTTAAAAAPDQSAAGNPII